MHKYFVWTWLLLALPAIAAERKFDFGEFHEGQTPPGFRSAVTGKGKPGEWKIILEDVPPLLAPLSSQAPPPVTKHPVLAQLAQDPTDEHFPLLIYEDEKFGDFTFTTRFKTVRGVIEQMAGIAFHVQNESNYYVVRASSLGNTFRFYKVLDGQRGPPVGPEVTIPAGVWHELGVECTGNQIRCLLDGKQLISVTDKANALTSGKIAFWTKSDSVTYFCDTKVTFVPFEGSAQKIVRDVLHKYPRLVTVKIYVPGKKPGQTRLIASGDESELGQAGAKTEQEVIGRGETYFGKENDVISVIMPLRDRNGDAMAAVRVVLKSFPGQTEENAILRAAPIVKEIQARAQGLDDLLD
ncbi:MAG TPA: family 16 glycoside hydrolase [Verrucomicrobiae bacterium]|nr:family 16 glycoside hydrolase [Verrucomicrobiae bacterium]